MESDGRKYGAAKQDSIRFPVLPTGRLGQILIEPRRSI